MAGRRVDVLALPRDHRPPAMADSKRLARARSSVPGVVLVVVVGFVLVSLVLRVVGAWRGVPVLSGDQVVFVPVARQWLEHGQLAHPFWAFPGASTNEYSWHGWLLPIALGWFATARHAQTLLVGPAMLALLSVAAFAVYARVARLGAIRASTLLVLIGAIASYSIGRPESLLLGLWAAALIGERLLPGRRFDALAAQLAGQPLVVDAFHRDAPSVWGLALGRTRKDYAFALYGDLSPCAE